MRNAPAAWELLLWNDPVFFCLGDSDQATLIAWIVTTFSLSLRMKAARALVEKLEEGEEDSVVTKGRR